MRFSPLVARIAGEAAEAWDLHYKAAAAAEVDDSVIVLSVGDTDLDTPAPITERLINSIQAGRTHYANTLGETNLRRAVAEYYQIKGFKHITYKNIAVMPGAQSGLFAAAQCLLSSGDEVIIPEPMYVTYPGFVRATGASIVPVSTKADGCFRLDAADIAKAITSDTRAVIVTSPNNPTGEVIDRQTFAAIARLCQDHDLWLISDEVYLELYYEHAPTSALTYEEIKDRVVVVSSLSKSHAMTGWRLGWIVGSEALINHLYNLLSAMLYGAPMFIQDAALAAFENPEIASNMRTIFKKRRDSFCSQLERLPLINCLRPEGGMFVMLDVRQTGLGGNEFAREFFEAEKVSLLSADAFGESAKGFLRVGLTLEEDKLTEVARRLERFLKEFV